VREREALQNRVTECNLKLAGERGNDSERERGEDGRKEKTREVNSY